MRAVVIAAVCGSMFMLAGCLPFCEVGGLQWGRCAEETSREFYDRYIDQETKLRNERLEREGRLTAYQPTEPKQAPMAEPDWRPWERQKQGK